MARATDSIVIENLHKHFGALAVLKGIDLTVSRGMVLGLLGPNGAGKTTTVRIISTLLQPDKGRVRVNGFDAVTQADEVRRSIGLTGQYAAVDEYLTGEENLRMMGRLYRLSTADAGTRAGELLEQFDLTDAARRPVKTYSGGMRRRLDLAVSLIASPSVLVLDEPTTGLDPRSRLTLWEIIKQLAATDVTILLTTQYMEEADYLADKIAVIDKGTVIAEGTPNELKARVGSDRVELTLVDETHFDKALQLLDAQQPVADRKRRVLSVPTAGGVRELKEVLQRLEDARVAVETVSLHRPTLDDVFLTLTGHKAEQEPVSAENAVPVAVAEGGVAA